TGTPMATSPKLDADLSGTSVDQMKYHCMIRQDQLKITTRRLNGSFDADHAACLDTCRSNSSGIQLLGEKLSAISISSNSFQNSRTKHIVVRYHFIKEHVKKGIVELYFVRTEYHLADMFIKALSKERFEYLVGRLGMRCLIPSELEALANEFA
nr:retrotransposon protein, putative, unclassified [Tanacetum cinerariifolium]GFB03566.1 retrotransposon protein, putative, unclassified [Tanacetum cinerariifolium]